MNKQRISLLTSGHPPFDERIYWKFAKSLIESNYLVSIFCSTTYINQNTDNILIKGFDGTEYSRRKKIDEFTILLKSFNPDLIICSEPLPVFAANKFSRNKKSVKIILDITEWFPENVAFKFSGIKKWLQYFKLFLPYIYILQLVNHIVVGEKNKKKRYDLLAFNKTKNIIGYYPVLKYFNYRPPDLLKEEIVLGYAGVVTIERGIINLLRISNAIAENYPDKSFTLLIFGKFTYYNEESHFHQLLKQYKSIKVEFANWTDYDKMSIVIEKMDICFDLRDRNFIYRNSLPIKIFEYMACGKPFIYADIKPISNEINIHQHGFLVNPDNDQEVISAVERYLNNPDLSVTHSKKSRRLIEENKNWENESKKLIQLVNDILTK